MKPARIWQGTDKTFSVQHDFTDLPSATEVEVYIDTPSQIIKTLGDGVSGVTSTTFLLVIDDGDTNDVPKGQYKIQAKVTTAGGDVTMGRIQPTHVQVLEAVWSDARDTSDY